MKYIKGLDTIRTYAILLVIIGHWFPKYPLFSFKGIIQHFFVPAASFGVNLFFVMSGYLITSILLTARFETQSRLTIIRNFIIRRSLRIFPIYYLFIGILLIMKYPFEAGHLKYFLTYTTNFLVIKDGSWNNFSHTWSLSVEEQFYLIWPWLILFVKEKYLQYVFGGIISFAVLSVFITSSELHMKLYSAFTPNCFDAFGIGGLYAYVKPDERKFIKFKKYLNLITLLAMIVYFGWMICPYIGLTPKYIFLSRTVESVISVWIINFVITNRNIWINKNLLENKILNKTGKISYGIYLFHYPFPALFSKFIVSHFTRFGFILNKYRFLDKAIMLILLLVISYLSFELFEKRLINLKNKFKYE